MTIYYTNNKILKRKQMTTYKIWFINGVVFSFIMLLFYVDTFSNVSFLNLLLNGIIHSVWIAGLYLVINCLFNKSAFKTLFELYRENKKI